MKNRILQYGACALVMALLHLPIACIDDPYPSNEGVDNTFGFVLSTSSESVYTLFYDDAEDYEKYLDTAAGDYRIYFFTANHTDDPSQNTLIDLFTNQQLTSLTVSLTASGSDRLYQIAATASENLLQHTGDFKLVVLANWGEYPDVTVGETTIADILAAECGLFTMEMNTSNNNYPLCLIPKHKLLPFYGLLHCSNLTPTAGTQLGVVYMIPAVAKVEVVLADTDISVENVYIPANIFPATGYAAPEIYHQDSYIENGQYVADSTASRFFPANESPLDQTELCAYNLSGESSAWVTFLPEHANSDGTAYVALKRTSSTTATPIYFTTDNTLSGQPYPLLRNHIYRFTVRTNTNKLTTQCQVITHRQQLNTLVSNNL